MIILGTYKTFFEKERNAPLKLIMKWAVASQTGFLVFVWLSGVTVAFSMWLAGKSSTSHGSVLAGLPVREMDKRDEIFICCASICIHCYNNFLARVSPLTDSATPSSKSFS